MPSPPAVTGFRSLTTRLIVWILLSCGAIFLVTQRLSNTTSRNTAEQVARAEAAAEARRVIGRIESNLLRAEDGAGLLATAIEELDPAEAGLEALLRRFVAAHPRAFGAAAAFEPGAWRPGVGQYALYVHRDAARPEALVRTDLATDRYRYLEKEWYAKPVRSGQPVWSEPYLDEGGGETRMVTFSALVFRASPGGRTVRGVVTVDLTLDWLNEAAQGIAEGTEGYSAPAGLKGDVAIVSRDGTVLAARHLKLGEPLLGQLDPAARAAMEGMLAAPEGAGGLRVGTLGAGKDARLMVTIRQRGTGWRITVLYPTAQVLASVDALAVRQASLVLAGLVLLAVVVVVLSRRLTRPLLALSASAGRLATGDLDAELPPVRSRDEIGRLTRAFHEMRDSLKAYIRDLAETTKTKERLESELRSARRIQMAMLPKGTAGGRSEGYELAATLVPARAVGGDLYDHFVQDSRVSFLVGDVSGKGVPAALFMARVKMLFETVAARETDPGAILLKLNRGLTAENDAGMFVTVVCGSLDTTTGDLVFACGGHEAPVHMTADGTSSLEVAGGPLLGLMDEAEFPVNALRMAPGEAVVVFTDGVSEAANTTGGMYGTERLVALLSRAAADSSSAVTESVLRAVREFAGEAPQSDDITIMTLRYLARQRG
jgi:phosphoserine phosphatase RsbU/P